MRTVRIFVSSPNDALDERRRVSRVVERLNGAYRDSVHLEAVRWEERFYSAHDGFQPQIPRSGECDLVLAILRGRLGRPLSQAFHASLPPEERLPDGAAYPSGTAYEILSAIRQRQRGSELPDIYVFRWPKPPQVSLDAPDRAEIDAQWQALKRFAEEVFLTPEGHFKGAYQSYNSLDDFEDQVEALLRDWLKAHVQGQRTVMWPAEWGSPFRGLEPFGMRHARVFFGRTREVARAVGKLKQAAGHGAPFQLVVGPSGAGKSSFVRAGLVPKLIVPGEVEGVGAWRVALMRPGESPEGPATALARRLFESSAEPDLAEAGRPAALPELRAGAFATPEALVRLLAHADDTSAAPIRAALAQVTAAEQAKWGAERPRPARLLLVVDQLDEIFATAITDEQRAGFGRLLEALGRTGAVWVVATLRAEFYEVFLKSPLAVLAGDERTFTLKPPGLAEMAEIVREPARAADLAWESDPKTGERLDERLLADIDGPDLLPLLQFVLDRLYQKREGGSEGQPLRLTFAAYRALGTLDGALDTAGRQALADLSTAEQARLPRLLRTLVTPAAATGGTASLALQSVPLARAAPDEASRRLAGVLVDARLLVTSVDKQGEPLISLAHQRVIEAWEQARAIIASSADFYRVLGDITAQRSRWESGRQRGELLIPRGVSLAEAEQLTKDHPDELPADDLAFVRASRRRANRAVTLFASLTAVFAMVAAFAIVQWQAADRTRREAEYQKNLSDLQRNQILVSQSYFLSGQAEKYLEPSYGAATLSALLALEALPDRTSLIQRPYVPGPEKALFSSYQLIKEMYLLNDRQNPIKSAFFVYNNRNIYIDHGDSSQIIDIASGNISDFNNQNAQKLNHVSFSPNGRRYFAYSGPYSTTNAEIYDAIDNRKIATLEGNTKELVNVKFSRDGGRIAAVTSDGSLRVWNAISGQITDELPYHAGYPFKDMVYSLDGAIPIIIISRNSEFEIWDIEARKIVSIIPRVLSDPYRFAFDGNGEKVVTIALGGTAQVWDTRTGRSIATLRGHTSAVYGATFSPDNLHVLTFSADNTSIIWNAQTGQKITVLKGHSAAVNSALFSEDGKQIVTASDDNTTRVWDARTGNQLYVLPGHGSAVKKATFSSDNRHLLTFSEDGIFTVWRSEPDNYKNNIGISSRPVVRSRFSSNQERFLAIAADNTIGAWNAETGKEIVRLAKNRDQVIDAIYGQDDKIIITRSINNLIATWDIENGQEISAWQSFNNMDGAILSANGDRTLVVSNDGTVDILDTISGKTSTKIALKDKVIAGASLSPDGSRVLIATKDGTVQIWSARSGRKIIDLKDKGVLESPASRVQKAAFSPDGRLVATYGEGYPLLWIWNVETGIPIAYLIIESNSSTLSTISISQDNRYILAKFFRGNDAVVWDLSTTKLNKLNIASIALNDYTKSITDAVFNSGQDAVLSSSLDGSIRLWDIASGGQRFYLDGMTGPVNSAAFSRDNRRVIGSNADGSVTIWSVFPDTQDLIDFMKKRVPRCMTIEEREKFFLALEPPSWCVEAKKWPYDTPDWQIWLSLTRQSVHPPLPVSKGWAIWLSDYYKTTKIPGKKIEAKK